MKVAAVCFGIVAARLTMGLVAVLAGPGNAATQGAMPPGQVHPIHVRLTADERVNGYTAEFQNALGQHIDTAAIHVDRANLDGTIERRDVATVAGPVTPSSFDPRDDLVPLDVPRAMLRSGMQQLIVRLDASAIADSDGAPRATQIVGSVNVYLPAAPGPPPALKRLEHATVYPIDVVTLECEPRVAPTPPGMRYGPPRLAAVRPLHVISVDRLIGTAAILRSGFGQSNPVFAAFEYKAIDPVRISFDPDRDSASGYIDAPPFQYVKPQVDPDRVQGTNAIDAIRSQLNRDGCRSIALLASDAWDTSLLLSSAAPPRSVAGDVRRGMTRDDVAFRLGFPSEFADRAEFNRRREWHYVRDGPFSSTVVFCGQRVFRYDPPGGLP